MLKTKLSLKWLEIFQLLSKRGSVSAVAIETGLSVSTVSHHLRSLENHLGVALLEHNRRPMSLTPAGETFLKNISNALEIIHKAEQEVTLGNCGEGHRLRIGLIEDFENDIAPELVVRLATEMPRCDFVHYSRSSHDVLLLLRNGEVDLGVVSSPSEDVIDLQEYRVLRDPFVLAVPVGSGLQAEEYLTDTSGLPFLRYIRSQIISNQIEAQLRRLKVSLPRRFEFESNQSMMAMVAEGGGWAITTPLCYMRASRFHTRVRLLPLPTKGNFSRYVSMFTTPECSDSVSQVFLQSLRLLLAERSIKPMVKASPWLAGEFELLGSL
jgi:DNA-binding transcriptional LysR family regulator